MRCALVLVSWLAAGLPSFAAEPQPSKEALIPALIENLDDMDDLVRQNIAVALANLGEAAVPSLIDALSHPKAERRKGAAMALSQVRPAATSAIPALLNTMKDKDDLVRRQASYALSRIVGRDTIVTPAERPKVPPLDPPPNAIGGAR